MWGGATSTWGGGNKGLVKHGLLPRRLRAFFKGSKVISLSPPAVRYGGETCYPGDSCPRRMVCRKGHCACVEPGMKMTEDGRFCLKETEKLLGEYCNSYTDNCFQPTGQCFIADLQ